MRSMQSRHMSYALIYILTVLVLDFVNNQTQALLDFFLSKCFNYWGIGTLLQFPYKITSFGTFGILVVVPCLQKGPQKCSNY